MTQGFFSALCAFHSTIHTFSFTIRLFNKNDKKIYHFLNNWILFISNEKQQWAGSEDVPRVYSRHVFEQEKLENFQFHKSSSVGESQIGGVGV